MVFQGRKFVLAASATLLLALNNDGVAAFSANPFAVKPTVQQSIADKKLALQQEALRKKKAAIAGDQRMVILRELYEKELEYRRVLAEKDAAMAAGNEGLKMDLLIQEKKLVLQKAEIQERVDAKTAELESLSSPATAEAATVEETAPAPEVEMEETTAAQVAVPQEEVKEDPVIDEQKTVFFGTPDTTQMVDHQASVAEFMAEKEAAVPTVVEKPAAIKTPYFVDDVKPAPVAEVAATPVVEEPVAEVPETPVVEEPVVEVADEPVAQVVAPPVVEEAAAPATPVLEETPVAQAPVEAATPEEASKPLWEPSETISVALKTTYKEPPAAPQEPPAASQEAPAEPKVEQEEAVPPPPAAATKEEKWKQNVARRPASYRNRPVVLLECNERRWGL